MSKSPKIIQTDMPFSFMSSEADMDYLLARMIHFTGPGFHGRAGFFAQMACEKYLKALTIQNEKMYCGTSHKLLELAELCKKYDPYFSEPETKPLLEQFDVFTEVGRYGPHSNFDPMSKGKTVAGATFFPSEHIQMAGAMIWTWKHLDDLDGLVFKIRSMLDFANINWHDGLKAILEDDPKSVMALWKFPVPLKDILTHQNRYFVSSARIAS